jgi:hypothetical protein
MAPEVKAPKNTLTPATGFPASSSNKALAFKFTWAWKMPGIIKSMAPCNKFFMMGKPQKLERVAPSYKFDRRNFNYNK